MSLPTGCSHDGRARSCSMATTCAFLVPARVLGSAPEAAPTSAGCLDNLRLAVFTDRERGAVLRLDFVLVTGASRGLRDAIRRTTSAPPRQITWRGQKHASVASSHHSNARFAAECQSILEQDDCSLACCSTELTHQPTPDRHSFLSTAATQSFQIQKRPRASLPPFPP